MPLIRLTVADPNLTTERQRSLAEEFTRLVDRDLDKDPEDTVVQVNVVPERQWYIGGRAPDGSGSSRRGQHHRRHEHRRAEGRVPARRARRGRRPRPGTSQCDLRRTLRAGRTRLRIQRRQPAHACEAGSGPPRLTRRDPSRWCRMDIVQRYASLRETSTSSTDLQESVLKLFRRLNHHL